jgi:transcriptional regulator with XRE-family HTH domain
MKSKSITSIPMPVRAALRKLGADIADARKRRRISTATMAERARISRPTLVRLERGDAHVSVGIFATVLFVLGMEDRLADLADAAHDRTGLDLQAESLPKRISGPRKKRVVTEYDNKS